MTGLLFGTYCRLGVSIYASDDEVVEAVRRKLRADVRGTERERPIVDAVLKIHHDEQALARSLRL